MDRVFAGEKLRAVERSADEQHDRLVHGEAWRDFCRSLERTGEFLLDVNGQRIA